ncbi:MAG: phospholipase D-like domain-containing protein [Pseudomonadota bacterium]
MEWTYRQIVQIVTEGAIRAAVLTTLQKSGLGDAVDLMMFYLSSRDVVKALRRAHERGANVRVLLDANKDAFGRKKNGIPNRPAAFELHRAGIEVRWCHTQGEQCHAKMRVTRSTDGSATLIAGSANFTRRNLDDYNLETNVVIRADADTSAISRASRRFEQAWENENGHQYSVPYTYHAEPSWFQRVLYRFMEWSGVSTF